MKPIEVSPKDKITVALRSGLYRQVMNYPYADGAYCLVGLAAHVLGMDVRPDTPTHACQRYVYDKLAPYHDHVGELLEQGLSMNDSGVSFEQLADWLDDELA